MAAAIQTTPLPLTVEEYLRTSYHPDCDFVDGTIEARNVGEFEHSTLQTALGAWFFVRRTEWKIRVASEYRTLVSENRVRIPDLSVFRSDGPVEKVRVTPPLICIEILSPEDRMPRILRRLDDYIAMGVPNIWLLDPLERAAFVYTRDGLRLIDATRLTILDSPIFLDLPELFSSLD